MNKRKILFLTGTRADFGKLKALIRKIECHEEFEAYVFATGMHMLSKYGSTIEEIRKEKFKNIYTYINQTEAVPMEMVLSNTIEGLSNYVKEFRPDMIVVHGDRPETLAGAIVGAFNDIIVVHIEGGEVSGTIDELLRHSISKLAHLHFVANETAKKRLVQMGENEKNIFVIGSPDLDIMLSTGLPSLEQVFSRYNIDYDKYSIFAYHPVTTEMNDMKHNIREVVDALIESGNNYIVIYPNNDRGTDIIMDELKRIGRNPRFKMYPSIRFEYYLSLLKNCEFIIGNSSAGIREAEVYGKAVVNIGTRQKNRHFGKNIINVNEDKKQILKAIQETSNLLVEPIYSFGEGNSAEKFYNIISDYRIWETPVQKQFIDI